MTEHRIGTQVEWQAERDTLVNVEEELTGACEALEA
jgi:predicted dithiol-disulfide oxidoreductase (DUF899 family)